MIKMLNIFESELVSWFQDHENFRLKAKFYDLWNSLSSMNGYQWNSGETF